MPTAMAPKAYPDDEISEADSKVCEPNNFSNETGTEPEDDNTNEAENLNQDIQTCNQKSGTRELTPHYNETVCNGNSTEIEHEVDENSEDVTEKVNSLDRLVLINRIDENGLAFGKLK